jgi:hypothetical protein
MKTGWFSAKREAGTVTGVSIVERQANIWFIVKRCVQSESAHPFGFAIGRDN